LTRIFKLKGFSRFQRKERILDTALADAIGRIEAGSPDADLGGDVIEQRIARRGQGKSGGYRTVIAIRRGDRAFFLYGFAKTERSNIDDEELDEFRRLARGYLGLDAQQLDALIAENELVELTDGQD
jgi:hypothetical protein